MLPSVTVSGNQLLVQSVRFLPRLHRRPLLVRPDRRQTTAWAISMPWGLRRRPRSPSSPWLTVPTRNSKADLMQLLTGATEMLTEAGAVLVGGHTGEGAELAFGLTVNGVAAPDQLWRKERHKGRRPAGADEAAGHGDSVCRGHARESARRLDRCRPGDDADIESNGSRSISSARRDGMHGRYWIRPRRPPAGNAEGILGRCGTLPGDHPRRWTGALDLCDGGSRVLSHPTTSRCPAPWTSTAALGDSIRASRCSMDPQTAGGLLASLPAESADACLAELALEWGGRRQCASDTSPSRRPASRAIALTP
jgi:hypothetical protein